MKFKIKQRLYYETIQRTWFTFIPHKIGDEIRWLETITVEGYWTNYGWLSYRFVDTYKPKCKI
jgi:hypothetical protein